VTSVKLVFALAAVIAVVAGSQASLVSPVGINPTPNLDGSIIRYNWNRTGVATSTSNIVVPHIRWTFQTNGDAVTGPLAYDVNRDGEMEIFIGEVIGFGFANRYLYSLDYLGNVIWKIPMKFDGGPSAIADLDHDGVPEIVYEEAAHGPVGGLNITVAYATNGTTKWSYTDHTIFNSEEGFSAAPVIYDVNGDGVDDLTLGSMDHFAYTFSGKDGAILWKSAPFEHYLRSSAPLADLNGDGEKDFVEWDNHAVTRAYGIKTQTLLWEQREGYGTGAAPAIGDLDGDGKPEIVLSTIVQGGIRAVRGDGSLVWANMNWDFFYASPTLVDVNGDSLPDVVNTDANNHTIIAFRGTDGVELWRTVFPNTTWSQSSPVTVDIDGDKALELLAGADNGLYCLDAKTGQVKWSLPIDRVRGEPRVVDIDGDKKAEILFGTGATLYVIDQAPALPRFMPKTIGYWKHQCNVESPYAVHVGLPQSFVDAIRNHSKVFANLMTVKQACDILWAHYEKDMMGKAKQQLLILWLNVVSGFVDPSAPIDLPKYTDAKTVGGAILDTENTILTHTDEASLRRVMKLCDLINNGIIK